MTYNLIKTVKSGSLQANEPAEAPALKPIEKAEPSAHRRLERKPILFMVLSLIAILIGGIVEMIPTFTVANNVPKIASVKPYTALELTGRDLYIREGCVNCHSQTIRPFRSETARYGEYSKAGEFVYDHPFLWGSKRTGPDLHRIGGKYPHKWHYDHMLDPTITSPGSIMPPYPWLIEQDIDFKYLTGKMNVMKKLGVPYSDAEINNALADAEAQAQAIVKDLAANDVEVEPNKEIVAMIAYLQRMGTDIKAEPKKADEAEKAAGTN